MVSYEEEDAFEYVKISPLYVYIAQKYCNCSSSVNQQLSSINVVYQFTPSPKFTSP